MYNAHSIRSLPYSKFVELTLFTNPILQESSPIARAIYRAGLQPQSGSPPDPSRQGVRKYGHGGFPRPGKRADCPGRAHAGTTSLLRLHLPTGRLHQNVHGALAPYGRERFNQREENAGIITGIIKRTECLSLSPYNAHPYQRTMGIIRNLRYPLL